MTYRLREGVTFAQVHDRAVFLDVRHDRYFCLPRGLETPFAALTRGAAKLSDHTALAPLIDQGLLIAAPGAPPPRPVKVTPAQRNADIVPTRPWLVLDALCARAMATARLRATSLSAVLDYLIARKERSAARGPGDSSTGSAMASAFRAAGFYAASRDRCLSSSLAIAHCLLNKGLSPHLYFGVQLPFAAHCWVQCGDQVLGDTVDVVTTFTPVLVV